MVEHDTGHTPVLPNQVLELLAPKRGETALDATIGLGGHAGLIAEAIGAEGVLIGLDVDDENLATAAKRLEGAPCKVVLERENFANIGRVLEASGVHGVDVLLADLGVSSTQLEATERGFSFRRDGPLDMRMDSRLERTAADLVNSMPENELADLIYQNAQERYSRRIARRICAVRREKRITRTAQLVEAVCGALSVNPDSRKSKIHPATRVFQALRIAVNDELNALARLLNNAPGVLRPGGRIGVIAFHSLEDGMVKRDFRKRKNEGLYEIVTKRPVIADGEEREANPRSRSAKLRVAKRISETELDIDGC